MTSKAIFLLGVALILASCASIPVERTSPCACDWQPINQQTEKVLS